MLHIVVLAAGKGTRMKSAMPKVLHRVAGIPMIEHVLAAARSLGPDTLTLVVGFQANDIRNTLSDQSDIGFVVQEPQLGTAHALMSAEATLGSARGTLILLSGDVPLLSPRTLKMLIDFHASTTAAATVVTAVLPDPHGYGRIVRTGRQIARIVEEQDATSDERAITEINAGIYAFALDGLFEALRKVATKNVQREYYLPELVSIYSTAGKRVETLTVSNPDEIRGINSRMELEAVSRIVRLRKNEELMAAGVTIEDSATAYIDRNVDIGADTIIHPGVSLEGHTTIGNGCEIHSGARIVNSRIGDRVTIYNHCVIADATISAGAQVGPFARLRKDAILEDGARVGNFVEIKKTVLGRGSKSMHLAYLGDATIGAGVNIGAGTITCNYDGQSKKPTIINDGAFIGSDSQLIAPVTVGAEAYVGTGTTIREDVPPGALAVSAGKQRNIEGWVAKRKKK
ncbi:MAG: bifunctional UDP-N-acetylglucosamine diphosphorylase/glucosamine-1-phosphate N-acetyltransferase GlmU [Blastocatellia bacterium]|nr:MAG: bifunctional UDP-N-acetylglucosamine diphosphorylase/glucosamine-1-phosphate N-acetyltransferase GlmU [Blastocatellia bacterium]